MKRLSFHTAPFSSLVAILLAGCSLTNRRAAPPVISPATLSCKIAQQFNKMGITTSVEIQVTNLTPTTQPVNLDAPEYACVITIYRDGTVVPAPRLDIIERDNNGLGDNAHFIDLSGPGPFPVMPFRIVKRSVNLSNYFDVDSAGKYIVVVQLRVGRRPGILIGGLATFSVPR